MPMTPKEANDLRRRAESYLNATSKSAASERTKPDPVALVHELHVHQAELEMQNDELRRTSEALEVSRQRYEELYQTVPVGYFTFDRSGNIQDVNPAGEALVGLSAPQLRGRAFQLVVVLRDREMFIAFCESVVDSGVARSCDVRLLRQAEPSGYRHVLIEGNAVPSEKGKARHIRAVVLDITERKRAESKLQQQEAELQASRQALQEMNAKVLTAQDDERRLLARELHDDCCQQVALLILSAKTIEPLASEQGALRLQSITEQLKQLLEALRQLAYGLHPAISESLGLERMIKNYVEQFTRLTQIPVQFEVQGLVPDALPQNVAICLYRTLQETLHNSLKYAQASTMTVRFVGAPRRVELTVADNGKGFDLHAATGTRGLGLISLRERVQLLAGTFEILSHPQAGTTIRASLPL